MKKVSKKLQNFIDSIAIIGDSQIPNDDGKIYYTKYDHSYLTRVGMENAVNFLLKSGITDQLQGINMNSESDGPGPCCIGFSPVEQKWYGWSHRAIFGFGVGSECKKGHIHYRADNKETFADQCLEFWCDEEYNSGDSRIEFGDNIDDTTGKTMSGVWVRYTYNNVVPNKKMRGTKYEQFIPFPDTWGRGEWTAKTLEDAQMMAVDFAKGIA